jgi:hypothetical protein
MVKTLYDGFLAGDDPRLCLDALRRKLKALLAGTHDWAGIVAYASLPNDFQEQLCNIRISRGALKIKSALNHADKYLSDKTSSDETRPNDETLKDLDKKCKKALERLHEGKDQLRRLLEEETENQAGQIHGLLASAEKREAEIYSRNLKSLKIGSDEKIERKIKDCLRRSLDHYNQVFCHDRESSWALVQQLWLRYMLDNSSGVDVDIWRTAKSLSLTDLECCDACNKKKVKWAIHNLIELHVIALIDEEIESLFSKENTNAGAEKQIRSIAIEHTKALLKISTRDGLDLYALRRQLMRYVEVFQEIRKVPKKAEELVNTILKLLTK